MSSLSTFTGNNKTNESIFRQTNNVNTKQPVKLTNTHSVISELSSCLYVCLCLKISSGSPKLRITEHAAHSVTKKFK
ncbi:hypothetical protein PA25_16520 [Pseudoalteromonas sp. A25]|nr:hypothetical protein PA25_16520 [Pseudoalteromonas sp. A25]